MNAQILFSSKEVRTFRINHVYLMFATRTCGRFGWVLKTKTAFWMPSISPYGREIAQAAEQLLNKWCRIGNISGRIPVCIDRFTIIFAERVFTYKLWLTNPLPFFPMTAQTAVLWSMVRINVPNNNAKWRGLILNVLLQLIEWPVSKDKLACIISG